MKYLRQMPPATVALDGSQGVYDLLGIGFGPSNLSLCALFHSLRERAGWRAERVGFLERESHFAWHPDMLIDGARMQIAFLKDLVTPRDPTSPFGFLSYLRERGRLEQFINLDSFYPTRREYNDYFVWAAEQLAGYVSYECTVEALRPLPDPDGTVRSLEVAYRDPAGTARSVPARSVVMALGGAPRLPGVVKAAVLGDGAFHSRSFLSKVQRFHRQGRERAHEFLVVGGGQSAAEVFLYLAREFPAARVALAFRGFSLMPANSSPHANEIFNPEMVDLFHGLPEAARREVLESLRHTNYAAVDEADIQEIARLLYEQRVAGGDRLRLLRFCELVECEPARAFDGRLVASLRELHTGELATEVFDGVVFGTGLDFKHAEGLLAQLEPHLRRSPQGELEIGRDYRVQTDGSCVAKLFVQGATEHTHGLTSTLISVLSHRSHEVLSASLGAGSPEPWRSPRAAALAGGGA